MEFNKFPTKKTIKELIRFIQKIVGDKTVSIGLSGGIDSTLTCELAILALGPSKVKGITLTNSRYSKESLEKVKKYVKKRGIGLEEVPTEELRNFVFGIAPKNASIVQLSTIDARVCDLIIKTKASLSNNIYLGTINGTERLTGWYPKGDLVGDLCPLGGILKEHEKLIAIEVGLKDLIETISEDASRVCSGCGELIEFKGINYSDLDYILFIVETKKKNIHNKLLMKKGISLETYNTVLKRIKKVKHKLDVFPPYPKIYEKN